MKRGPDRLPGTEKARVEKTAVCKAVCAQPKTLPPQFIREEVEAALR